MPAPLLLLLCACLRPAPLPAPPRPEPAGLQLPGIQDAACDDSGCFALLKSGLLRLPGREPVALPPGALPADTLLPDPGGWRIEGPCAPGAPDRCAQTLSADLSTPSAPFPLPPEPPWTPAPDLQSRAITWKAARDRAISRHDRLPFDLLAVDADAVLTILHGESGAAQIVRTGQNATFTRLSLFTSDPLYEPSLALHPSRDELYVLAWPSPLVVALNASTLARRWHLVMDGPAQGLFLTGDGRFLVFATGDAADAPPRPWHPVPMTGEGDPLRDERLRLLPPPPVSEIHVVEVETGEIAASVKGKFRRFLEWKEGFYVVTDREIRKL